MQHVNDVPADAPTPEPAQLLQRIGELEDRLARYDAMLAQFPGGAILLFDRELSYTLAAGSALDPMGMPKVYLEGKTVREALPPETWEPIEQRYQAALDGQPSMQEVRYGDSMFEMRTQPLYDRAGHMLGGMVVAMDITARKVAEHALQDANHALQDANQRLIALKEEMPDAFFRLDRDWRFAYVNHQAEPLLDRHAAELIGRSVWEEFPEALGTPFEQHYRAAMQTQQAQAFEQFYPPLNRWFEVRAVPTSDSLSVFFHDVSDRKRAELDAREQAELFQTVIDQMSDGVILADPNGHFRIFNRAAQRIFGSDRSDAGGAWEQQYGMFLPDQQTRFAVEDLPLARAMRGEDVRDVEVFVRHAERPDGLWITVNGRPVLGADGQLSGGLVVCRDETDRRRGAAEREMLQEEIIRMQSVTLRELSTPLIPINDQVVVMPLIGSVDSYRAEQVMETLLDGITRNRAQVAILDITGVPVVDTQVANALLRIAQSAKLLGTRVVLTGIRPEVAQTLVGLGVGLGGIITRGTLQSGIAYAMGVA